MCCGPCHEMPALMSACGPRRSQPRTPSALCPSVPLQLTTEVEELRVQVTGVDYLRREIVRFRKVRQLKKTAKN